MSASNHDMLVWRPDAYGSICFLVSGVITYHVSRRRGRLPMRGEPGWWQPGVNLLGCVFFGIAAVAGYVVGSSSSMLDQAAANVNTSAGAACFLACAVGSADQQRGSALGGASAERGRGQVTTARPEHEPGS